MECGCTIGYSAEERYEGHNIIEYCPVHDAAPAMLEMLKDVTRNGVDLENIRKIKKLIATVEREK